MASLLPRALSAQCPDGTPPPCAGARAPAPPDPNRIAILPFRVTTADTLLGEGLAEILANEFTGEGGPRAVDVPTMLRSWRAAGGDPRHPLPLPAALRLARELNAGLVVQGTVVGLGGRLALGATVLTVPAGETRDRFEPVSGPADSLEPLVRRLTNDLLTSLGVAARPGRSPHLSESPAANRAYLEGLAAFRRGGFAAAAPAFERAFALDSTFARAALMRAVTASWFDGAPAWLERARSLSARLPWRDSVLVMASNGGADVLRRAIERVPDSPELYYELGDEYYHEVNAGEDPLLQLARAREAFLRSLALDTQVTVLTHLFEISCRTGDTALMRRLWPSLDHLAPTAWGWGWLLAATTGDAALLASLRRRARTMRPVPGTFMEVTAPVRYAGVLGVPGALLDEMRDLTLRFTPPDGLVALHYAHAYSATIAGRPGAAARSFGLIGPQIHGATRMSGDALQVLAGVFADGDEAAATAAATRLASASGEDSVALALGRCVLGLWRVDHGSPPGVDSDALIRSGAVRVRNCGMVLALRRSWRAALPDFAARLATLDSARNREGQGGWPGVEHLVRAAAWVERGDYARALFAVRQYRIGNSNVAEVPGAREEGRLATLLGDTAAALHAYHRYLRMRADPEPVLISQRDSVAEELARLERRP